jgi:hypothetical protein
MRYFYAFQNKSTDEQIFYFIDIFLLYKHINNRTKFKLPEANKLGTKQDILY